jgi:hypothetical protein
MVMQDRWTSNRQAFTALCFALGAAAWTGAAEPEVHLRLRIPPAATHVIGDTIPLYFQFENRATNPLAFMWEGCCRFNGKLTVTRGGEVVPPTPPGQALAHMFAKAERLDPGVPKDFDTRLSDWVMLNRSGTYELRGHYQGVLPFQKPQVPRGLELWRGTADSPPLQVSVLSVADYLAQRPARTRTRGLDFRLAGPTNLPPLAPSPFKLKITNRTGEPRTIIWPQDFQFWLVNAAGVRVLTATDIEAPREEINLAAGAQVERPIPFDSRALEGEPWGAYRAFVELIAGREGQLRVPSNAAAFQWRLDQDAVLALLREAAAGHQTGLRNSPLKLLRVYVAEILPMLDAIPIDALTPEAARLASQLRIAGCLKPLLPLPGLLGLEARVPARGPWRLHAQQVVACLGGDAPAAKIHLASLVSVRRHLGWEIAVTLRPDETSTLLAIKVAAGELAEFRADLATEPRIVVPLASNRVSTLAFPAAAPPANLVIRVEPDRIEAARRLPDPQNPARDLIAADALEREPFTLLSDEAALAALLADGQLPSPRIVVQVSGALTWRQFLTRLDPLLQRGLAADVLVH